MKCRTCGHDVEEQNIQVGTTVTWTYVTRGRQREREGVVLAVVPPGVPGVEVFDQLPPAPPWDGMRAGSTYSIMNARFYGKCMSKRVLREVSYIVLSGTVPGQPQPTVYWPRPYTLRVKNGNGKADS